MYKINDDDEGDDEGDDDDYMYRKATARSQTLDKSFYKIVHLQRAL
jgi:hypothetical protein